MGQALNAVHSYRRIENIKDIHRQILEKHRSAKKWSRNKVIATIIFCQLFAASIVALIVLWPDGIVERISYILILIAVLAILLLIWMCWWFLCDRQIEQIKIDVAKLNAENQCELERIKETETYNDAQELLHKYGHTWITGEVV